MLAQGPSQAIVSLEWDSLWTLNKKIIDPIAPRFWAISKTGMYVVSQNCSVYNCSRDRLVQREGHDQRRAIRA